MSSLACKVYEVNSQPRSVLLMSPVKALTSNAKFGVFRHVSKPALCPLIIYTSRELKTPRYLCSAVYIIHIIGTLVYRSRRVIESLALIRNMHLNACRC